MQRQFVSDVSHELRTPLTTIRIAADVLFGVRDQMDAAVGRSAELLQSQLERFESLLTDLLEISRYDANAATLDAEPADVGSIVRQSADVAQQLAERRGARIEFRLPAEACIAEVDRRRVERILRNLLQNAVEHGENKDIVVTAAADSGAVAVSVRDFGVGLQPGEEQARVRPVLARRPGPGADLGRHRARPGHRAGGRPAARRLARGVGRAGPWLRVPADAAAPGWLANCTARRCRSIPRKWTSSIRRALSASVVARRPGGPGGPGASRATRVTTMPRPARLPPTARARPGRRPGGGHPWLAGSRAAGSRRWRASCLAAVAGCAAGADQRRRPADAGRAAVSPSSSCSRCRRPARRQASRAST